MTPTNKLKPKWVSAALALILSPMIGMLYLGKGKNAVLYLAAEGLLFFIPYLAVHYQLIDFNLVLITQTLLFRLIGANHCYSIAKKPAFEVSQVWFSRWYWIIGLIFIIPFLAAHIFRGFLYEPFNIPAKSMMPSLMVGDTLIVSKFSYGYSKYSIPFGIMNIEGRVFEDLPERGDIAVFKLPTDPKVDYIQRIIGFPGDTVQIKSSILYINGQPIKRKRIGQFVVEAPYSDTTKTFPQYTEILPNGRQYQILETTGDEVFDTTILYTVPEGHYFSLGDHRDRSRDSRYLNDVGYIPFENLVGKLSVIYWNSLEQRIKFLE